MEPGPAHGQHGRVPGLGAAMPGDEGRLHLAHLLERERPERDAALGEHALRVGFRLGAADEADRLPGEVFQPGDARVPAHQEALAVKEHRLAENQPVACRQARVGRGADQQRHLPALQRRHALVLVVEAEHGRASGIAEQGCRDRPADIVAERFRPPVRVVLVVVGRLGDGAAVQVSAAPDGVQHRAGLCGRAAQAEQAHAKQEGPQHATHPPGAQGRLRPCGPTRCGWAQPPQPGVVGSPGVVLGRGLKSAGAGSTSVPLT